METIEELEERLLLRRFVDMLAKVEPFPEHPTECFDRAGMRIHVQETPFGTMLLRLPFWKQCERCSGRENA